MTAGQLSTPNSRYKHVTAVGRGSDSLSAVGQVARVLTVEVGCMLLMLGWVCCNLGGWLCWGFGVGFAGLSGSSQKFRKEM